jgi:hypothetical protein
MLYGMHESLNHSLITQQLHKKIKQHYDTVYIKTVNNFAKDKDLGK